MSDENTSTPTASWVQYDPNTPGVLICSHSECEGRFVMQRPIGRVIMAVERRKSELCGATPTDDMIWLATLQAHVELGFSSHPEGFDPGGLLAFEEVCEPLTREVTRYWESFRAPK